MVNIDIFQEMKSKIKEKTGGIGYTELARVAQVSIGSIYNWLNGTAGEWVTFKIENAIKAKKNESSSVETVSDQSGSI